MVCDLLDIRCIFMNELVGSAVLASIFAIIFYFIVASKIRLGFDATIVLAVPLMLMVGLTISGFSAIYAFTTVLAGFMLAWIFQQIIGNR